MSEMLLIERTGPGGALARVTLNRPDVHNAFNAELIGELRQAFRRLADQPPVQLRAVVLAGAGPSFCAGADVNWMRASLGLSREDNEQDAMVLAEMLDAIDRCPVPVIARVQGAALTGRCASVSSTKSRKASTRSTRRCARQSTTCSPPGRRPPAQRRPSSARCAGCPTSRRAGTLPGASPRNGPAPRGRRGCARSSRSASRPGARAAGRSKARATGPGRRAAPTEGPGRSGPGNRSVFSLPVIGLAVRRV